MGNILERIATEAIRQGWWVRQTEAGQYLFRHAYGNIYVTATEPTNRNQFQQIINDLCRLGFLWPPPHEGKKSSGDKATE